MSLSSYDPDTRYRYRSKKRKNMFFLVCLIAGIFIFTGYSFGIFKAKEIEITETMTMEDLLIENTNLKEKNIEIKSETNLLAVKYKQLEDLYNSELPDDGNLRELVSLLREQLDNGVNPERLEFVIRSARPPTNCSSPEISKFVVKTPTYKGAKSELNIGKDEVSGAAHVVISAIGSSAKNSKGQSEAWFDLAKPIKVSFVNAEGKKSVKKRVLPFQHSVVSMGREYRFSLEAGARSFIKVNYDSCDYP